MLPLVVWQMPEYGTFNLHASLLPDYRGAAPINWAIINGETETGVTTFFIDEKIDTGAIILQEILPIRPDETAGSLHDKLMVAGADLVLKTVERIGSGNLEVQEQRDQENLKAAPKIDPETCRIDWERPVKEVYNHIRGLSPYPGAWTTLYTGGEAIHVKIYKAGVIPEAHGHPIGHVAGSRREMRIAGKEGSIVLEEIQLAGKRRMTVQEVLNGLKLEKSAYMA